MNLSVSMRSDKLLSDVQASIVTNIPEPKISFYGDDQETPLCVMYFSDAVSYSVAGNIATYQIVAQDGPVIRGVVAASGTVKSFRIPGKINIGDDVDELFITGTVGGTTSSADMKFNKIVWTVGMNIQVSDLFLSMS